MGRIYDAFTFFNELDILDLRLKENGDLVDYFVICESPLTFKGESKPLYFAENRRRFSAYDDKIIHIVDNDLLGLQTAWQREHHQREFLRSGLTTMNDGDVVIVSDVDEIPKQDTILKLRKLDGVALLDMPMFQFYLNMQAKKTGWNKAFAASSSFVHLINDFNGIRSNPSSLLQQFPNNSSVIEDAGWHFTFLGGAERVRQKLRAYSHAGDVVDTILEAGGAENQMLTGRMIGSIDLLRTLKINSEFPKTVLDNLEHFRTLGFVKDLSERLSELEQLRAGEMQQIAGALEKRLNEMRKEYNFVQQRRQETGKRLQYFENAYQRVDSALKAIQEVMCDEDLSDQQKLEIIAGKLFPLE